MTGKAAPKCLSVARSDGVCVFGFTDGGVALWPTETLRSAAAASREKESEQRDLTSEGGGGDEGSAGQGSGGPDLDEEKGEEQESVDSLPFMLLWDEKTGRWMVVERGSLPLDKALFCPTPSSLKCLF